ncbi:phosphoprotein phosphatase [Schizosaccharomyces japonicus yFS275]|uniref:Phosphoprotein phosphatase n=1 Tax=Schizosaccharomyces japonicus (strain yFS275 / FY16936) TaxID=402676 RepID=B6K0M4_SCHJY|nr:phosphoprotein phosphatase [Schizosaccharomyces japonicus yFS275]EEB07495.1 phosphoprotein phosphatase [Schizosaccharomyces japonicus yFS275]
MLPFILQGFFTFQLFIQCTSLYVPQQQILDVSDCSNSSIRPLELGQLNILHTTDIHGWLAGHRNDPRYDADFGDFLSFVKHVREIAEQQGVDLLLVDTGDLHDGTGLSDLSNPPGSLTNKLFSSVPYDLLVAGNHELYVPKVALDTYLNFVPLWQGRYLASNVQVWNETLSTYVPFGERFYFFQTKHSLNVLALGFVQPFSGVAENIRVQSMFDVFQESWWHEIENIKNVDVIILLLHIPVRQSLDTKLLHAHLRQIFPHVPIQILGGHSHVRDFTIYDSSSTALQSGRYCETLGWMTLDGLNGTTAAKRFAGRPISLDAPRESLPGLPDPNNGVTFFRKYIDWSRQGFEWHINALRVDSDVGFHSFMYKEYTDNQFDTPEGSALKKQINSYRASLNLTQILGYAPKSFAATSVPPNSSRSIYYFYQNHVLPEIVVNPERSSVPRLIAINSGAIRGGLQQGPFTNDELFQVSPFRQNTFVYIKDIPSSVVKNLVFALEDSGYLSESEMMNVKPDSFSFASLKVHNSLPIRPGYTTDDAFGVCGDDTPHMSLPFYKAPNYLCSEVYLNKTADALPESDFPMDVVTVNFVVPRITPILNHLLSDKVIDNNDWQPYFYRDDGRHTLTDLLLLYAEKHRWTH